MTIQRDKPGFADPDSEISGKIREELARQSARASLDTSLEISPRAITEAKRFIDLRNKAYGLRQLRTTKGMKACLDYIKSQGYPISEQYGNLSEKEITDLYIEISAEVEERYDQLQN